MRAHFLVVVATALWAVSPARAQRSQSPNDCVIVAAEKQSAVRAAARLRKADIWTRVLLVRYAGNHMGHAFCVFEVEHRTCAYDATDGTVTLSPTSRDANVIARQLGRSRGEPIIFGRFLQ